MSQQPDASGRARRDCIVAFLKSGRAARRSVEIKGQGYYYDGLALYSKPPGTERDPSRLIMGRWRNDGLHLKTIDHPLRNETAAIADELGISYVDDI